MKKGVIIISLSLILVLSLSLVSAGFLDNLFRNVFGGFPVPGFPTSTGQVTGEEAVCTDSDGTNYLVSGSVTKDGLTYKDYCIGNTNYDFYCGVVNDGGGAIISFLPLTPSITGAVVGDPTGPNAPPSTSIDCMATYQVPCNGDRCGCVDGTSKTCGPIQGAVGQCKMGTSTCSGGLYGSCVGAVYPTTEICDGIDNDCDGSIDGVSCVAPEGEPGCISGTQVSCGIETGECNPGTKTCTASGTWGACGGASYVKSSEEICSNTLDENCNGFPIQPGSQAIQSCSDELCDGQSCGTGKTCSGGFCVPQPQSPCTDSDLDTYDNCNPGTTGDDGKPIDCNPTNININPGATEICGNNVDEDCSGSDLTCPSTPSCTDTDEDRYSTEANPTSCNNKCGSQGTLTCLGGSDCNNGNPNLWQLLTGYPDADEDGLYSLTSQSICSGNALPSGYRSTQGDDCNDGSDSIKGKTTFYTDGDNDGYGNASKPTAQLCTATGGYSSNNQDCNDNSNTVYPNAQELCTDNIDNNCVGGINENCNQPKDYYCDEDNDGEISLTKKGTILAANIPSVCTEVQGRDCNDNSTFIKPGAAETCDNIDNDCDENTDEGLSEPLTCRDSSGNVVRNTNTLKKCTDGAYNFQNCVDAGYEECTGSECTFDEDSATCTVGIIGTCSTNIGICAVGAKYCGSDGMWEATCDRGILPKTEVCLDDLDNDCDGVEDETDCVSSVDANAIDTLNDYESSLSDTIFGDTIISLEDGSTKSSGTESSSKEGKETGFFAFLKKLLGLLGMIFKVGHILGQPILEDISTQSYCTDSDMGKNYFLMGNGEGLNQQETQLWFEDFCYEGDLNNKQSKCAGSNCFLNEYYCDGKFIASEPAATCKYGCVNGACVPDASLSDNCQYFDKEKWEMVNIC